MIGDIEARAAGSKGLGVFAKRAFGEGEFLFRRRHSRVVTTDGLAGLSDWDRLHVCELGFERFAVLTAPGCYLNHSCDPNAMRHGTKVFAWRPITAGAEITIDYRLNAFGGDSWPCDCGSERCPGTVVGSFFAMDAERQSLLLPHAPPFIRSEYRRRQNASLRRARDEPDCAGEPAPIGASIVSWTSSSVPKGQRCGSGGPTTSPL